MTDTKRIPTDVAELRRRAKRQAMQDGTLPKAILSVEAPEENLEILHELKIHQIELQMQNEELLRTQIALEASRNRFSDLYDLAPTGYCTLSEKGLILEINLTGSTLLGMERSSLIGRPLSGFILPADQEIYYHHRQLLVDIPESHVCELRLARTTNSPPFWVRLETIVATDGNGATTYRSTLSDISEEKRAAAVQIFLAQTTGTITGEPFFNHLARYLAEILAMDFVCIDRLEEKNLSAKTLAVWCDGHFEDNITYSLHETPCGEVLAKTTCCFPVDVCRHFPEDKVLQDLRAESYVGVTLFSRIGAPIGLIAVIGRTPLVDQRFALRVLNLVAGRAAGELERIIAEEVLNEEYGKLEWLIKERTAELLAVNAKLQEQNDNLDSIFKALDNIGLIVYGLIEDEGLITTFSSGAEKLFGLREVDALGKSITSIYPPEYAELVHSQIEDLSKGNPLLLYDATLIDQNGDHFPAIVSAHPFDWRDGKFHKAVGIFRNISELLQAQEQLRRINEDLEKRVEFRTLELQETHKKYVHAEKLAAIGKLSASIAHEFNNPLQGILTILKGLKKRAILAEGDGELLDAAITESHRLKDLIRNLQEFNRPSTGQRLLFDVHKALDSILLLQKSDLQMKQISTRLDYDTNLPQILAVSDQIKQVFLNLLNNATDACKNHNSLITIRTRREGARVAIAIEDNGIGIEPENMELLFQPFYTTKPEVKGTGLGLPVSLGIVRSHGGEITVQSKPGEGAVFTVFLPIAGGGINPAITVMPPEGFPELASVKKD